jgi:pyrimidine-specific ribonucleoside hydrolase
LPGNTSIYNATSNALTVLQKLDRQDVPVVMGAAGPRQRALSKAGYFIHGPDGLWFLGWQNPHDLSRLPNDAPAFYCASVAANPGAVLLALGPLTNIAAAVERCPATMRSLASVVVLGGAKYGGNQTPVAEFNFWQDPEAAEIVLAAGLPITLIPLDAFAQPTLAQSDLDKLFRRANPAIQFLAPAIQQYAGVQIAALGSAKIPDAVAAAAALDSSVGVRQSGLVRLVLDSVLARGQSVIALTTTERVAVITEEGELDALAERAFANPPDPAFDLNLELAAILARTPDNAQVALSVDESLLTKTVLPALRGR